MKARVIFILSILLLLFSCIKEEDYFKETAEGRNFFSFTMNGTKFHQETSGGFPSEYPTRRYAKYKIEEEDGDIEISADLNSTQFPFISMDLALDNVYSGSKMQPDTIVLRYLYLPYIFEPIWREYVNKDGGWWGTTVKREAEYRPVNITKAEVKIRKWSPDERILAGNFTFSGHYADSTGTIHNIKVTDGKFDLTDQVYPR